ncbi:hypothetical protein [Ruminococcus albus]|uniref:LXG domain of WXG superfamily protein n=1 Tax=Ruminococcus albus TaxID=1264 RepID=A0A1I1HX85_RUMAL|nr:hypothetical protein [Ruminococcus albus]SFC28789.1 hypothetical protein SAMN02910406_01451 [Ruminococcus albus]
MGELTKTLVLDEEAFDKGVEEFAELSTKISKLRKDIEDMLTTIESGFDTPAGHKFIDSCKNNLLEPLDKQEAVVKHISDTLKQCRQEYSSVFSEYNELVQLINN